MIRSIIVVAIALIAVVAPAQEAVNPPVASPTKTFTYKKTKQAELEIVVHYPPGWKETDKRPGIVFFFGGGWTNGTIKAFERQATYLAGRGMVAARADYRVKSRQDVTPKECVEDAKSAVRWVRANCGKLGICPAMIVAAGGSAGGHIAACTAFTSGLEAEGEDRALSSEPDALVLFNPVLRMDLPPLLGFVGRDEALAKAISPTLYLAKDSPPTLLFFGTADRLLAQGEEFMKKSKELGHKAELFTAEGQGHGFFNRPPWQEKTTQRMDEFLVSLGYIQGKTANTNTLDIKTKKTEDQVEVETKDGTAIFTFRCPTGIGGATIEFKDAKWPEKVVLRLRLKGLESLTVSNGKIKLTASVLSHSGNTRLLAVVENGKEKKVEKGSPYWTELRGFDSTGKPVAGLPGNGGYFESVLPKALLESAPKSLSLEWIDFYRG